MYVHCSSYLGNTQNDYCNPGAHALRINHVDSYLCSAERSAYDAVTSCGLSMVFSCGNHTASTSLVASSNRIMDQLTTCAYAQHVSL